MEVGSGKDTGQWKTRIVRWNEREENMNRKAGILASVIAVIALCLSAVSLYISLYTPVEQQDAPDVQYVVYLGTNDKDTNAPVYTPEEARARAEEILIHSFGGYTIQEADGGWVDDAGTVYQEYTLVIYLSDTTMEQVHAAADTLIDAFHQSSVLIQANATSTEFYSGRGEA